jgi:hypothetical protein
MIIEYVLHTNCCSAFLFITLPMILLASSVTYFTHSSATLIVLSINITDAFPGLPCPIHDEVEFTAVSSLHIGVP